MTQLTEMLLDGWEVMTSPHARLGEPFVGVDGADGVEGTATVVFHPLDYNAVAYSDDPFKVHEMNMDWIYNRIEEMADLALAKLDKLVDDFNKKHEPQTIVQFHGPMFVEEILEEESGNISLKFSSVSHGENDIGWAVTP